MLQQQKIPQKLKIFGAQKIFDFLVFQRSRDFGFFDFAERCTKTKPLTFWKN